MDETIKTFVTKKSGSSLKTISPCILHPQRWNFHQVLRFTSSSCLDSIYIQHVSFCTQNRVQMSENVNNDVRMNPPGLFIYYTTYFF